MKVDIEKLVKAAQEYLREHDAPVADYVLRRMRREQLRKALEPFSGSMDAIGCTAPPGESQGTVPTGEAEVACGDGVRA